MPYTILNGKTFNGIADADGLAWRVEDVEGWDSPDVELTVQENTGDDGGEVTRARLRPRSLVVRGSIVGPTIQSPWTARTRVAKLANLVRTPGLLIVKEDPPEVDKQVTAHLEGRIRTKIVGKRTIDFEIPLLAPDPRKYATGISVSGVLLGGYTTDWAINHVGTTDAHWVAEIRGGVGGVRLKHGTGASDPYLWVETNVGAGDVLTFDSATHTITLNGENVYDDVNLAVSEWWKLRPGMQTIRLTADWVGPGARADIIYRAAYL